MSIAEFRTEYARADKFCSEVQNFVDLAGAPAMSELRYAGHHLLIAIDDKGNVVDEGELRSAVNHAKRACYDASEAGVMFALETIAKFKNDFASIPIRESLSEWQAILEECRSAKDALATDRSRAQRDIDHVNRIDVFKKLCRHCGVIEDARDDLLKVVRRERWKTLAIYVGALGVGATMLYSVAKLLGWSH